MSSNQMSQNKLKRRLDLVNLDLEPDVKKMIKRQIKKGIIEISDSEFLATL